MLPLVTIQKIKEVQMWNVEFDIATVLDRQVAVHADEFRLGQLVVYFAPGVIFQEDSNSLITPMYGDGYRVRVKNIQGIKSHGILMSTKILDELLTNKSIILYEGMDITELFSLRKG